MTTRRPGPWNRTEADLVRELYGPTTCWAEGMAFTARVHALVMLRPGGCACGEREVHDRLRASGLLEELRAALTWTRDGAPARQPGWTEAYDEAVRLHGRAHSWAKGMYLNSEARRILARWRGSTPLRTAEEIRAERRRGRPTSA